MAFKSGRVPDVSCQCLGELGDLAVNTVCRWRRLGAQGEEKERDGEGWERKEEREKWKAYTSSSASTVLYLMSSK